MFRILESQAPARQTASDTISTLSARLQSATLLEDRRAAILGLRSFAKLYPASVASGALRNLINSLSTDGEDVETAKVVLETLLMLFSPEESSASDDIALWLADEFTQRQENITVLLDLLDRNEFFSRLYALQLISAISSARLERTQECVYTAPLGVTRLVAVLDDKREAIRTEGLLLLVALTPASVEVQKLVAFENAFDRAFAIIDSEGSLSAGGIIVQDCLSLLANLLRLNVSNQSFFRETGGVAKVATVLQQVLHDTETVESVPEWGTSQRDKNIWGVLSIIRLFLAPGGVGTQMNQKSFWQNGVAFSVLDIAFHPHMMPAVKSEAFMACADLIRANSKLQEGFAQRDISILLKTASGALGLMQKSNGQVKEQEIRQVNVIQGLLDTALAVSLQLGLDVRLAACECIKAYLEGHAHIRLHFLRRARDGHSSESPEPDNILTILLQDPEFSFAPDPYRHWIAAVILYHLVSDDYEAKKVAMEIVEGDAEKGEDTVTCIQALSGNLISKSQRSTDDRVTVAYLMVLAGWLFEDPDAVNDFLQEGTNVQSLIQMVLQPSPQKVLEAGLCAFLLGIIYEFSSKDSPIARSTLHEILTTRLGREQYNDKMLKLREHHYIRDFEVLLPAHLQDQGLGLQEVHFDKKFVDFVKDNFSRITRAIDKDPNIEISVLANGVQKGISRELVDSLQAQLDEKIQSIQKAESEILSLEQKLGQEQADHRKSKEQAALELGRIRSINENLQKNYEEESQQLAQKHRAENLELQSRIREAERNYESMSTKMRTRYEAELRDLDLTTQGLQRDMEKSSKDHAQDLNTAHEEYTSSKQVLESQLQRAKEKLEEAELRASRAEVRASKADELVQEKESAKAVVQTELDDLLLVLGDLEEKRERDKARLKALGESISDEDDDGILDNEDSGSDRGGPGENDGD